MTPEYKASATGKSPAGSVKSKPSDNIEVNVKSAHVYAESLFEYCNNYVESVEIKTRYHSSRSGIACFGGKSLNFGKNGAGCPP